MANDGELSGHGIELEFEDDVKSERIEALRNIKREALRLAGSGRREDFKLVERLFKALPELREL